MHKVNLVFSNDTGIRVNIEGNESELPFNIFTNEGRVLLQRDPSQIHFSKETTIHKNDNLWVVKGNLTAPSWFLRQISDYSGLNEIGRITSINFKKKTVRIDKTDYNLNPEADKKFLEDRFSQILVENNLVS